MICMSEGSEGGNSPDDGVEKSNPDLGEMGKKQGVAARNHYALIPCTAHHLAEGTRRDRVSCGEGRGTCTGKEVGELVY